MRVVWLWLGDDERRELFVKGGEQLIGEASTDIADGFVGFRGGVVAGEQVGAEQASIVKRQTA